MSGRMKWKYELTNEGMYKKMCKRMTWKDKLTKKRMIWKDELMNERMIWKDELINKRMIWRYELKNESMCKGWYERMSKRMN